MFDTLGLYLSHQLDLCELLELSSSLFCSDVLLLAFTLFVIFSKDSNKLGDFEIGQTCEIGLGQEVSVLLGEELGKWTYLGGGDRGRHFVTSFLKLHERRGL